MQGRILLVEDELLTALWLEELLVGSGYEVIGPLGSVDQAIAAARYTALDGAVLDVQLKGGDAYPIASVLGERRVPYLFLSGLGTSDLRDGFGQAAHVEKPVEAVDFLARVEAMMTSAT